MAISLMLKLRTLKSQSSISHNDRS